MVPLVLAVIFLTLQMVLYVHDTVWTDAWLCTKNQERRWQEEIGSGETPDFAEALFAETPKLVVLRLEGTDQTLQNSTAATQAIFRFCLLPEEVTILMEDFPETVERRVSNPIADLPGWMRKAEVMTQAMSQPGSTASRGAGN